VGSALPVSVWLRGGGSRNRQTVLLLAAVRLSLFHPLVVPVAVWQHDEGNRRAVLPLAAVRLSLRNEPVALGKLPLSFASMFASMADPF
jgi:hypothetical protein